MGASELGRFARVNDINWLRSRFNLDLRLVRGPAGRAGGGGASVEADAEAGFPNGHRRKDRAGPGGQPAGGT
jgi:hypothetical protein